MGSSCTEEENKGLCELSGTLRKHPAKQLTVFHSQTVKQRIFLKIYISIYGSLFPDAQL